MGVDITHIIRHDFHDVRNRKAAEEFTRHTIEKLQSALRMEKDVIEAVANDYDDEFLTQFRLPAYDMEFILHDGYWEIDSYFHYCQIVMHSGDYFWLRERTFDLARALGEEEAWYSDEYHTCNCAEFDIENGTFDEWLTFAEDCFHGQIPEFDMDSIMKQGNVHIPDYEVIYHDSFKECREKFDDIQRRLGDVKLLGLKRVGNAYRCLKDGQVVLMRVDNLEPLIDIPFERVACGLNGPELVVYKDGKAAVFGPDGKQLTDFVKGTFRWKWADDYPHRIIYNNEAGIKVKD